MKMETLEMTEKKLLIHTENDSIGRITAEAEARANILNALHQAGLSKEDIQLVTQSLSSIDEYILKLQLLGNEELMRLHKAGIKAEAKLPDQLATLSYNLKAWYNYPTSRRGGNKFENLTFTNKWVVDETELESLFIRNRVKIYIEGEMLNEYRELEKLCSILHFIKMPSNQVADSSVLWARVEPIGSNQYKPRWTWFARER